MTTSQLEDLASILIAEDGYKEGPNNENKYSAELGYPADAWCYDFLCWGEKKVGISEDAVPYSRYVPDGYDWGQAHGRFYEGTSDVRRGNLLIVGHSNPKGTHIERVRPGSYGFGDDVGVEDDRGAGWAHWKSAYSW